MITDSTEKETSDTKKTAKQIYKKATDIHRTNKQKERKKKKKKTARQTDGQIKKQSDTQTNAHTNCKSAIHANYII